MAGGGRDGINNPSHRPSLNMAGVRVGRGGQAVAPQLPGSRQGESGKCGDFVRIEIVSQLGKEGESSGDRG